MRPTLVVLFIVNMLGTGACSRTHEPHNDRAVPVVDEAVRPGLGLNVPNLLRLSIDEISHQLGPRLPAPVGFLDPILAPLVQRSMHLDSTSFFRCRSLAIIASYDNHTRQVSDLILLGSNEKELMSRAQLQLGAANYLVLPVFQAQHPTRLLGLRVVGIPLGK